MPTHNDYKPCLMCPKPVMTATGLCQACRRASKLLRCSTPKCTGTFNKTGTNYCAPCSAKRRYERKKSAGVMFEL